MSRHDVEMLYGKAGEVNITRGIGESAQLLLWMPSLSFRGKWIPDTVEAIDVALSELEDAAAYLEEHRYSLTSSALVCDYCHKAPCICNEIARQDCLAARGEVI